jgi:hypothetical protein
MKFSLIFQILLKFILFDIVISNFFKSEHYCTYIRPDSPREQHDCIFLFMDTRLVILHDPREEKLKETPKSPRRISPRLLIKRLSPKLKRTNKESKPNIEDGEEFVPEYISYKLLNQIIFDLYKYQVQITIKDNPLIPIATITFGIEHLDLDFFEDVVDLLELIRIESQRTLLIINVYLKNDTNMFCFGNYRVKFLDNQIIESVDINTIIFEIHTKVPFLTIVINDDEIEFGSYDSDVLDVMILLIKASHKEIIVKEME